MVTKLRQKGADHLLIATHASLLKERQRILGAQSG